METTDNVYSNRDITVTYEPCVCINAERCASELSNVFRQSVIPWIDLEGDSTERIIRQVRQCPSGALKFSYNHINNEVA